MKNIQNARVYGDFASTVWTAALGVTAPTTPTQDMPSGWYDVGFLDQTGVNENPANQETEKYGWQGASLIRTLRSQFKHPFAFTFIEENPVTKGIVYPKGNPVTTGGTAEVQTVTISGAPSAGTFTLTVPGYGSTPAQTYNVATTVLATALTTLLGQTVTVSGTAGSSYIVTFPTSVGNITQMNVVSALTGGSASVATTTPGVNPVTTYSIGPSAMLNLRQWAIDLVDGNIHHRYWVPTGEAVMTGATSYTADDWSAWPMTLNPYVDGAGFFYYDLGDNPLLAAGQFI